ncbi:MAG: AAA family ATPase [Propionivibrio sp.]|nr:AAA family ATPase [Propionivibrio sp.]
MKIIKLTAENVKRLRAVEITPDGTVQVITGRNAQGKTSVLDAIWLALGGGAASRETVRPIRDGEDHASVTLDLGDLTVTRTWTGDKTSLSVKAADGAKYSSPQGVLDSLVGRLSFDPLEFTRLSGRDQVSALLDIVSLDVDLDDLARQRQTAYDQRTEIGRQGKAIGDIPTPTPAPDAEASAGDLIAKIREAGALIERQQNEQRRVQEARVQVADLTAALQAWKDTLAKREAAVAAHVAAPDVAAMEAELDSLEETNRAVRANADIAQRVARREALRAEYDALTARIDGLDKTKADALAQAQFPVDGLGFDEHGVTYQGVPFSQASSAEQIRVSLAMAMSLNPRLRVIRILDGSLLDADNLALISEMAAAQDYQVWIERVADGTRRGVVIEDGAVSA